MADEKEFSAIDRKAYEIAYALCRISEKTGEPLGGIVSRKGLELLSAVVENDMAKAGRLLGAVGYFLKLGSGIGNVSQINADTLLSQLGILSEMILNTDASISLHNTPTIEVDLSGIFSEEPKKPSPSPSLVSVEKLPEKEIVKHKVPVAGYPAMPAKKIGFVETQEKSVPSQIDNDNDESSFAPLISSDTRQSEILDLVRQSGNCRMKDLQDMFPRCSERTLRYDIETLIKRQLIERIGAGSATSYQPVDLASVSTSMDSEIEL
jgi:hypothetical protein